MTFGKVYVGADFLVVASLALYLDTQGVVPVALLGCAIHELGHLMALYALGGRLQRMNLSAVGAEMAVEGRMGYGGEVILALAGPFANLLMAMMLSHYACCPLLCGLNLALAVLNLLPVQRLDGGRAVHGLCSALWGIDCAQWVGEWLERGICILLLVMGCFVLAIGGSFTLLLLAIWVLWGGKTQKISKKTLA